MINAVQTHCLLRKTRFKSILQGERVSHAKLTHVKRISHEEQTRLLIRENAFHTRSKRVLLVACTCFTTTAHAFVFSRKRTRVRNALYLASDGYCRILLAHARILLVQASNILARALMLLARALMLLARASTLCIRAPMLLARASLLVLPRLCFDAPHSRFNAPCFALTFLAHASSKGS